MLPTAELLPYRTPCCRATFAPPHRNARRRCLPLLKSALRGFGWEDGHWCQLFSKLGFRHGTLTKETVTLAHFLDKADVISKSEEAIRALDAAVRTASNVTALLSARQRKSH